MSFSYFVDYLQLEKKYSSNTLTAYISDLKEFQDFLIAEYAAEDLSAVNYPQIRNWIVRLSEKQVANRSINRKISSLKAYYRFLLKTKQIEYSPLANHKALKTPKKVQVPFSEIEVFDVLGNIDTSSFSGIRDRSMVELFYATGIRRIELINIKLTDVDFKSATLKVLGKRNKERYVPLIPSVLQTLKTYMKARNEILLDAKMPYLFVTEKGVKIYESLVYRLINNYFSEVSGKLKKSPHILRHSFATHLLNQGANLNAVKELLGHTSLAATQVYTHNSISELSKAHRLAHPRSKKR